MKDEEDRHVDPLAVKLTAREREVLDLVARQLTNRQIADELVLQKSTVRWYLRQIYSKLGSDSRDEVVARAKDLGLVPAAKIRLSNSNVPSTTTPFFGRETELETLSERLLDPQVRLISILGPGGIGKTRLALTLTEAQAARRIPGSDRLLFPDGVWFASLASIDTAQQFTLSVASALQLNLQSGDVVRRPPDKQVTDYLHRKQLLLVLDNMEHLPDAAPVLIRIMERAPGIKLLVTSRGRLQLQGEHLFWLQGLELPREGTGEAAARNGAVRLFLQTARRVRPGKDLGEGDIAQAARICRLLEGMPLAVELAASWAGVLSFKDIEGEVRNGLEILATELRDLPERHRSMRAALQTSWRRLKPSQQKMFTRLSIFRGGFTAQAAQAAALAELQDLRDLVERCWLARDTEDRFQIHELLRRFGTEELSRQPEDEQSARARHSRYYCSLLHDLEDDLRSAGQEAALVRIGAEIDNVRAAWQWAAQAGNSAYLERAAFSLGWFFVWRFRDAEGEDAFRLAAEALVDCPGEEHARVRVVLLAWQAYFTPLNNADPGPLLSVVEQALSILNSPGLGRRDVRAETALISWVAGSIHYWGNKVEAEKNFRRSLDLFSELGDRWMVAQIIDISGDLATSGGDYENARELLMQSLAIFERFGDPRGAAQCLNHLTYNALPQGRFEEAIDHARAYLSKKLVLGDKDSFAEGHFNAGRALIWSGEFAEGTAMLEESLPVYLERELQFHANTNIAWQGWAKSHLGEFEAGARQIRQSLDLFEDLRQDNGIALLFLGATVLALEDYPAAEKLLQKSADLLSRHRVPNEHGKVIGTLGHLHYKTGHFKQAQKYLLEALEIGARLQAFSPLSAALPVVSRLLVDRGKIEQGLEVYALVARYPPIGKSRWFAEMFGNDLESAAELLPPEIAANAVAHGRRSNIWETAEKWLSALKDSVLFE